MNRRHNFYKKSYLTNKDISRETAIHEAGHATAIYLGNKQKELPPVSFHVFINSLNSDFESSVPSKPYKNYIAKVEGGRLIHILPSTNDEATKYLSSDQKLVYTGAFEADIINMLAGPLAEAKYIALRDNELFNPKLINLNSLNFYGGLSDLKIVNEYLECFIDNKELREAKITELFMAAFNFVNERSNWHAITKLADYILNHEDHVIGYDEITYELESSQLQK